MVREAWLPNVFDALLSFKTIVIPNVRNVLDVTLEGITSFYPQRFYSLDLFLIIRFSELSNLHFGNQRAESLLL